MQGCGQDSPGVGAEETRKQTGSSFKTLKSQHTKDNTKNELQW